MAHGVSLSIPAIVLATLAALSSCGEAGVKGDRKEFRIFENQLRMRLEIHAAYHKQYPADLSELEEPEPSGYKLPKLPPGYQFDYDSEKGTVRVRGDATRKPEAGE